MNTSTRVARMTEWWRPKAGTIVSLLLFYLLLSDVPFSEGWKLLAFSVLTLIGFGLLGYLLNDWADIPYDRKVNKTNLVEGISPLFRWLILIALLVITIIPWLVYLKTDMWSWILIGLQIGLQFAYPLPPIRLKNYPIAAIIADSLYAFVIPTILAWHTFDLTAQPNNDQGQWLHFAFLGVWMFAMGVRQMLNHHISDLENDRRSDTPNIAVLVEPRTIRSFVQRILFPIEVFGCLAFFASLQRELGFVPLAFFMIVSFFGAKHLKSSYPFFSVGFSKTSLDQFAVFVLGFLSCVLLTISEPSYLFITILFLLLFTDLPYHPIVSIAWRRSFTWFLKMAKAPYSQASLTFNWSLFYFRKWILNWSEERNWGSHYSKHLKDLELAARRRTGTVAVFNQNFNKYTETFVNGHLKNLPFNVIAFHGWPTPIHVGNMENLLSDEFYFQSMVYSTAQLLNSDATQTENAAIARRLIDENVNLILAEFGTMGARLVDVARMTGIPMIVIFYGYDAWNKRPLEDHQETYQQLFKETVQVIGVSKDICRQLEKLGCPKDKITYLPCYVNLDKFAFVEREFASPDFLSVGRFCQTKAPQLTIMAFAEVLKQLPDATLRMIGADDGNGVLESCKTLVRSLKIEEQVVFVGSCSSDEVFEEMKKASMFIQHSVTTPETGDKEGTPVAIMEAMATGLAVVSTRHAGIAEMIEHDVNGKLVDEFDYFRMAEEMLSLIKNKEELSRLGKAASESIRSNSLVAGHTEHLTEIINVIISKQ